LLKQLLSCLCADVNNISHDSCDLMCLIYASMFTLLFLLSPGECPWSWQWVSSFHEVSSVLKCWLLVGASLLARSELTPLLLSRWCTDTPNQQCRSDFILSKSNILNVFILGFRRGTWIDWIPCLSDYCLAFVLTSTTHLMTLVT
jgi:hypothetical protein